MSIEYYDQNAEAFFRDTVAADMSSLRACFLTHVPLGGAILDAGCGAGRDAAAFHTAGYRVTAFDGSAEMVRLAREHTGLPVIRMTFDDVSWVGMFDGIWASASLLHVQEAKLQHTLARLAQAMRPDGVLYMSFKYGHGERDTHGRRFTDMTEQRLSDVIDNTNLSVIEVWRTADVRQTRSHDCWLNALARRGGPAS